MSLEEIKSTVAGMPPEQQNQLAAWLVHLRHLRDPDIRRQIASRNSNGDPNQWISLEQLRQKWTD